MSSSDGYFDDPIDLDADALEQLDAIEAAALGPAHQTVQRAPSLDNDDSYGDLSFNLDPSELERLDHFIADSIKGSAQPAAGPSNLSRTSSSRATLQTTLFGDILPPEVKSTQPRHQIQRSKSTSNNPFGRPAPKTKKWDHTAFSKTGTRKTAPKSKGKAQARQIEYDGEDEEEIGFEQFPAPFVPIGPPPPMRLVPDLLEARHWIYPLNRPKRDYQYNIVKHSLFENTLVALPTGLGKTFVAGVVMLNYYRWFPEGKVVFIAPTKPLVAQQIDACHQTCGIPGHDAIELTGENARALRAKAWHDKRVIYMTPQTLINDLVKETCDPLDIVLLVIDEAHRATGNHSYAQVVRFLMAKNPHFRILALTATPGGTPDKVQDLVDALHISRIEIRDENSLDLRPFIHEKRIEQHIIKMNDDINKAMILLAKLMESIIKPLQARGITHHNNVYNAHPFYFQKLSQALQPGQRFAFRPLFQLSGLARAMGYLQEASVSMCYNTLQGLAAEDAGDESQKKPTAAANAKKLRADPLYQAVMQELELQKAHGFAMHPKLDRLKTFLVQHFAGQLPDEDGEPLSAEETRAMVFVTFRDCVEEIVEALNFDRPMLRAAAFIGQGTDKQGRKGISQKEQLELIKRFKDGEYNVLVATSIGEEGLDIGEVDLIICYDAQKTPIRMLQRVGRTGRKRSGCVHVLLAEGREEQNFDKAKDAYSHVQKAIWSGAELELYGDVERLLPDHIKPVALEKEMEIVPYVRGDEYRRVGRTKSNDKGKERATKGAKRKRNDAIDRNIPYGALTGFLAASKLTKKRKITYSDKDLEAAGRDNSSDLEIESGIIIPPRRTQSSTTATTSKPNTTLKRAATIAEDKKRKAVKKTTKIKAPPEPTPDPQKGRDDSDDSDVALRDFAFRSTPKKAKQRRSSVPLTNPPLSPFPIRDVLDLPQHENESPQDKAASGSNEALVDGEHDMSWLVDGSDDDLNIRILGSSPPKSTPLDRSIEITQVKRLQSPDTALRITPSLGSVSRPSSPLWPESSPDRTPLSPVVTQSWRTSEKPHPKGTLVPSTKQSPDSSTLFRIASKSIIKNVETRETRLQHGMPPPTQIPRYDPSQSPTPSFPVRPARRTPNTRPAYNDEFDSPSLELPPPSQRRLKRKTSPSCQRERKAKHKTNKELTRLKDNSLFDMTAEHSGEEVSEGSSHSEDDIEDEDDRAFCQEFPETQVSTSYDQSLIYRQSLMTQVPGLGVGPAFKDKPMRRGRFGPNHSASTQRQQLFLSSSPQRGDESPNEYHIGSFVVDDDAEILYSDGPSFV